MIDRKWPYTINDTVDHFKSWAKGISDFFSAAGWTRSGDSGQVDWASLVALPPAGTYIYEIWCMGDALQATAPVYVKMEYARINTQDLGVAITLGTGSNGSGTLTNAGTRYNYTWSAYNSTSECLFSGDTNRIMIFMWRWWSPWLLCIERSKDSSGDDSDEFVYGHIFWPNGAYRARGYWYDRGDGGGWGVERWGPEGYPLDANPTSWAGYVQVLPWLPVYGWTRNPLTSIMRGLTNDWTNLDPVELTPYPGKTYKYLVIGKSPDPQVHFGNGNWVGLYRWE